MRRKSKAHAPAALDAATLLNDRLWLLHERGSEVFKVYFPFKLVLFLGLGGVEMMDDVCGGWDWDLRLGDSGWIGDVFLVEGVLSLGLRQSEVYWMERGEEIGNFFFS